MKKQFFLCGSIGCSLEVFWTGFHSFFQQDFQLRGQSSIWMFPIYGLAFLICPISKLLKHQNLFVRGSIYTLGIFCIEFITGSILKALGVCPWDYSKSPFHINGVIRLDYAPVWFFTGLLFEKILSIKS